MSRKFYSIKVNEIRKTTPDCVVITLDIPQDLQELFNYKAGQYLTFKHTMQGEEIRRTYSLCSSPYDKKWEVAVKEVPGGLFSSYANNTLQPGDALEVLPPNGRFTAEPKPETANKYVAFAAGSGITPTLSIIKTLLEQEPNCTFQLFFTNQSANSIILKEEIEALKNLYLERFELFHFLTKEKRSIPLFNGRMDVKKLNTISKHFFDLSEVNDVYICGPKEMIFTIRDFLIEHHFPKPKIHFELFFTGEVEKKSVTPTQSKANQLTTDVSLIEGGKMINFIMARNEFSILDAALNQNADLPFACKGGVCCTCRAKILEGKVEMKVHYGLEDEELKNGYVLTCQSFPISDKVVIDYDVN